MDQPTTTEEPIENQHDQVEDSTLISIRQYVEGMYDEFKRSLESRNIRRIEKIIRNIESVDPQANVLNLIHGTVCLYHGDGIKAYSYLMKFSKNSKMINHLALYSMGMWNMLSGNYKLANEQFGHSLNNQFSVKFVIPILICMAKTKKRLGFYDKSLRFFERILRIPEGFKLILLVKLEIIHIYILKEEYEKALFEIDQYMRESDNFFIRRLKAYVFYLQKRFTEFLSIKIDTESDPFVLYLVARAGMEGLKIGNNDISFLLDRICEITKNNKYVFNTYGNFYYNTQRFSDAAEMYNRALNIDPSFEPALTNVKLFLKTNSKTNFTIYTAKSNSSPVIDTFPEIEEIGFFDTWNMLGFPSLHVDHHFIEKSPSLMYYLSKD
jgi:tetratricopeptide (TPR) repeat protein